MTTPDPLLLVLDLETYYDKQFSLRKLTVPQYVHDPRFKVHGLAIGWPEGAAEFRTDVPQALQQLQATYGLELEGAVVVCHNALFDLYVLNHLYGVKPARVLDTLQLAHHVHGRKDRNRGQSAGLGDLARHYGLPSKQQLDFMEGVRDPTPGQLQQLSDYARHDVTLTRQLCFKLLPQVSRPEIELPIAMHTVKMFAHRRLKLDTAKLDELIHNAQTDCEMILLGVGLPRAVLKGHKSFEKMLGDRLASQGRSLPVKLGRRGDIAALAKDEPAMQLLCEDEDPQVAKLCRARLDLSSAEQRLRRLEKLRDISTATGGYLPPHLVYYGAHTGRFSGGGGFNLQNMGRSGEGAQVRSLIVPEPEHRFIIADLAQIEARITAWYAREGDLLDDYRQGKDIYCAFASHFAGQTVRKPTKDDPPELCTQLKQYRQLGKQAVLGLGYGMGAAKFEQNLRKDPSLAPLFAAGELDTLGCAEIQKLYRRTYPGIPEFWRQAEAMVRTAIETGDAVWDRLEACMDLDTLLLKLPSGRCLRYPKLRIDPTPRTHQSVDAQGCVREWTSESTLVYEEDQTLYGGKIVENIVQATARDLLVEAVLKLEARGYPVLFHVHDELIVQAPLDQTDACMIAVEEALTTTPDWAAWLPIDCEVKSADRYGK